MKRSGIALLLGLALCGTSLAQSASAVRKQAEASMLVNGHIVLAPDGSVRSCSLDQQDRLPAPVVDLIKRNAATWRFEPIRVDGTAVAAEAPMHLRVVASPTGDGDTFHVHLAGATFSDGKAGTGPGFKEHKAPRYPEDAIRSRVAGTVFLLIRVQPDGTVGDIAAEQVNLTVVDNERAMRHWRDVLAEASIRTARNWTFTRPADGTHKNDDSWIVRVPVAYHLNEMGKMPRSEYGTWQAYIPGPKDPIPWMEAYRRTHPEEGLGSDALPDEGLYLVGSGPRLITPLNRS